MWIPARHPGYGLLVWINWDASETGLCLLGVSFLVVAGERGHVSLEVLLQLVERSHGLIKRPGGAQA